MLYELPARMDPAPLDQWPAGIGGVPAELPDGTVVQVPVLQGLSSLVVGTTGVGKTVYTKAAVRAQLRAAPETLGVFFQIKPDDFTSAFLSPGDKIITYSPHNPHVPQAASFKWNMIREIREAPDREAAIKKLGGCLFHHLLEDPRNRVWAGAARDTFSGFLRVIVECFQDSPSNGAIIRALRGMDARALLRYLSKHPRNHSLVQKTFDFDPARPDDAPYTLPRKGADVLFFLNDLLESFGGNFASDDGTDTIADFLHGRSGKNLFFLHDLSQEEATRPFELYFLQKIIEDKMSPSTDIQAPILLVLDEADKIGANFGAGKAATLGRGYGLQLILSTQSLESLFALGEEKNREHATTAALAGFPVKIAFHCSDPATIRTMQTLFGSVRREITTMGVSRYAPTFTKSELEPIVSDSDFSALQKGECIVKLQSHPPQKVKIIYEPE